MLHRSFFTSLLILISYQATAEAFESPDKLRESVEVFLVKQLMSDLNISNEKDVQVRASNIDPRLKLQKCHGNIAKTITTAKPYRSNLSVRLQCLSKQRWSIYVPAQISVYSNIAVVSRSLERGAIIDVNDIILQRSDVALVKGGYIKNKDRLIGMQLKRRISEGQAIRLGYVKNAQVIKKGDKVTVEASSASFSVVTTGKALSSGSIGQQISVRNTRSKRIVDAKIVAPGRVQVTL